MTISIEKSIEQEEKAMIAIGKKGPKDNLPP
jgi:hypothetical protein